MEFLPQPYDQVVKRIFAISLSDIFTAFIAILIFVLAVPVITYTYFAAQLQTKETIMNNNDTGVTLFDRNGTEFFTLFQAKHKNFVPISDISKSVQEAVVAIEDKDFYTHKGFSIKAILRSIRLDIEERQLAYGGSTITQQLVKNALLTPKKSFFRKFQEVVLAFEIERRYSKEEILEMYLNSAYFGEGAFGAEAAAEAYFDKSARDLNLAESALLVGVLKAPTELSPLSGNREQSKLRQQLVLSKMVEQGFISREEKEFAESKELTYNTKDGLLNNTAIHFAMMVRTQLVEKYGEEQVARSGFKVKTTIDLTWQGYAEKVVTDQVVKLAPNRVTNGAAVVLNPKTGEIKAWVGSKNWYDGSYGKVDLPESLRQPGSSFKPIIYSAALEKGLITPATALKDQGVTYNNKETGFIPYSPKNYDGKFRGSVTVRRALSNSLNVPAVEVMSKVGVPGALEMAHRLGITTLDDSGGKFGLSLVLGAGEVKLIDLATVYATFANSGIKNEPAAILEIMDKQNQIIYDYQPNPQPVLDPGIAFLISSILSDSNTRREVFGNTLDNSLGAAVKTGTTENYKDAWTMGYTPNLVVGAWVGNNDGALMDNIAGSLGAAPIWKNLMEEFSKGQPLEKFTRPQNVLAFTCKGSPNYQEYFLKGMAAPGGCSSGQTSPTPTKVSGTPTPIPNSPTPTNQPSPTLTSTPTSSPTPTPKS